MEIANNGACLQGRVNLLLRLPVNSQPFGLAFDGNNLYIGDSENDAGYYLVQSGNFTSCYDGKK